MKTIRALLLLTLIFILGGTYLANKVAYRAFETQVKSASGAIFVAGKHSDRRFNCSGTEIGKTKDGGGIFLTARHCVVDPDTNKINQKMVVSFSANQSGPFYDATPVALSLSDDLALLYLNDGADIPAVKIKDERRLSSGDPIFNVSFPVGTGKATFHGEYMGPRFPALPEELLLQFPQWVYSMPMNLTIAPGSSGSGVFSQKEQGLIAVTVGSFGQGSYNIAIPADRVLDFLNDLPDNTVEKFKAAFPEKEAPAFFGFFGF